MPIRPIRLFPDDILSSPCRMVEDFGPRTRALVQDLWDTLYHSPGVGLAAPQIGILLRLSVIDCSRKKNSSLPQRQASLGPVVLINPVLLESKGIQIPREGCLSVPDYLANVRRLDELTIQYQDLDGKTRLLSLKGFEALAVQHEMDHLEGKLFLDRVANLKTDLFRRKQY